MNNNENPLDAKDSEAGDHDPHGQSESGGQRRDRTVGKDEAEGGLCPDYLRDTDYHGAAHGFLRQIWFRCGCH